MVAHYVPVDLLLGRMLASMLGSGRCLRFRNGVAMEGFPPPFKRSKGNDIDFL